MATTVQTDTEPARQRARRALRVLVADDERDTVLTLSELLREEGHEVHGVYKGTDVMPAIREFDPDVVLHASCDYFVNHHHGKGSAIRIVECEPSWGPSQSPETRNIVRFKPRQN